MRKGKLAVPIMEYTHVSGLVGKLERKPKLLFLINTLDFFLSHRLSLAKAAQENGFEIHVVAPPSTKSSILNTFNFFYHPINLSRKGANPFQEAKSIFSIYKIYIQTKPDLVHHFTIKPMLYGSLAGRIARVPHMVNSVTGLGYVFSNKDLKTRIMKWFVLKAYKLFFNTRNLTTIFQNPDDLDYFLRKDIVAKNKANLIKGSGVNTIEFQPSSFPSTKPVVMLPSRMIWEKGIGDFAQAAIILKKKGIFINFVLVGTPDKGNPNSVPEIVLLNWNQEGILEWWGHKENMPEIINMASIICLPSFYREGVPKVLIEAAACGRPIITTNEPGCREIVKDGVNGFLIPIKNPQILAEKILLLINNPLLMEKMGQAGRDFVKNEFSEDLVIKKTLQVYKIN